MTWWVLQTGATREFAVGKALKNARIDFFLPHRTRTFRIRTRGDKDRRKRTVMEALFPGYVFVDPGVLDSLQVEAAIDKKGRIVKIEGTPLVINDDNDDGLKDARLEADENGFVGDTDSTALSFGFKGRAGTVFKFTEDSPFWGHAGIIVSTKDLDRNGTIVAFIELFKAPRTVVVTKKHVGEFVSDMSEVTRMEMAA